MTDIINTNEVTPQGYHYTDAGVLPKEWISRPLSSIVEEITETAGTKKIETVSISAGMGFVNQAEKFGKELSGKQYEKYTVYIKEIFHITKVIPICIHKVVSIDLMIVQKQLCLTCLRVFEYLTGTLITMSSYLAVVS